MGTYNRLDRNRAALLVVDQQAGLFALVRDIPPDTYMNNVLALAAVAKYFSLPVVVTSSFEEGPNGPTVPELRETFPNAPYIARPGEINAWDNADFVRAVEQTGRKQLLVAGIVTEVCVSFVVLSALQAGYEVFVVTDASGTFNDVTRYAAWDRMSSGGAQLLNWFAAANELQRDWRNDVDGFAQLLTDHIPDYRHLAASYAVQAGDSEGGSTGDS
jgi:nicotinamidase-related amidase